MGYAVGGLSMVVTAVSDYNRPQGLTWGTGVKEGIGALEIAFPEFGLIYGGADILTGVITGKTLTDRIGDGIDNIH